MRSSTNYAGLTAPWFVGSRGPPRTSCYLPYCPLSRHSLQKSFSPRSRAFVQLGLRVLQGPVLFPVVLDRAVPVRSLCEGFRPLLGRPVDSCRLVQAELLNQEAVQRAADVRVLRLLDGLQRLGDLLLGQPTL